MNIKWKRDGSSHYVSSNVKGVGIGGYKFQFVIERKEFRFPFKKSFMGRHVSWDLYDGPLRVDRCDTLKEAKELAQDVSDERRYGDSIFIIGPFKESYTISSRKDQGS